jgi:hypothetical protein
MEHVVDQFLHRWALDVVDRLRDFTKSRVSQLEDF